MYTVSEGGVVRPECVEPPLHGPDAREPGPTFCEDAATMHYDLRCVCIDCRAERETIRAEALASAGESAKPGSWADRPWNGPFANYPGTTHDDTGPARTKRIRTHRPSASRLGH